MAQQATHWADIQEKTFTRWINDYLREKGMKIESLKTDLGNGLVLCNLLKILSKKKFPKYNKHPRITAQKNGKHQYGSCLYQGTED